MELTLVLSVGLDAVLVNTRNLVLQSAGYTVVRAYSLIAALDCFKTFDFDLVLLCQSLPASEKDRLTSWIRATGSRIPVISVSEKHSQRDAFADASVESDPEALLACISEALVKAVKPAACAATYSDRLAVSAMPAKNSSQLSASYKQRTKTTKVSSFPLARAV